MWWVIGFVIGGIIGIANEILKSLQKEVAVERKRWEDSYQQILQEVRKQQSHIEKQIKTNRNILKYKELSVLHSASIKTADTTYNLLQGARKTLDAMGRAIVDTAKQRKLLEQRKRRASFWEKGNLEKQIVSLQKLRDQILIPDKDKVKAQRDRLSSEVKKLNKQTAEIRNLKEIIRIRNKEVRELESYVNGVVKWYEQNRGFGFISYNFGNSEIYFNEKQIQGEPFLNKDDQVKFIIKKGNDKPWAKGVEKIN